MYLNLSPTGFDPTQDNQCKHKKLAYMTIKHKLHRYLCHMMPVIEEEI
jgi:hypothetical protein